MDLKENFNISLTNDNFELLKKDLWDKKHKFTIFPETLNGIYLFRI